MNSDAGIWSGARPTSSAAPPRCPESSAASSAASSTSSPREALTKNAPRRIAAKAAAFISLSVSACAGARQTTKSDSREQPASGNLARCGRRGRRSAAASRRRTRMPKASARSASCAPMRPRPITPSVEPRSSRPTNGVERTVVARGRGVARDAAAEVDHDADDPLATAVTNPGLACVTRTPCALAAATSTVRMSTAQRMNANSPGSSRKSASGAAVWR